MAENGLKMVGKDPSGIAKPIQTDAYGNLKTKPAGLVTEPVTGIKQITATASEIFAGANRLANRRSIQIKNEDPVLRFRVGGSGLTQQNGYPVEPGASVVFDFDQSTPVPIYVISEGARLNVGVIEE